ncbi:hypothetical protein VQ643_08430 [Pseudomonas sp. F1_0610]|uniref:hypothetical protein n=1 Tax=Pseudomonas sp. F1_0610 TaxID=3114284 RepID=UPI0039C451BD
MLLKHSKSPMSVRRKAVILIILAISLGTAIYSIYQENKKQEYRQQFFASAVAKVTAKENISAKEWYRGNIDVYTLVFTGVDGRNITRFKVELEGEHAVGDELNIFYNPSDMGDKILIQQEAKH